MKPYEQAIAAIERAAEIPMPKSMAAYLARQLRTEMAKLIEHEVADGVIAIRNQFIALEANVRRQAAKEKAQ